MTTKTLLPSIFIPLLFAACATQPANPHTATATTQPGDHISLQSLIDAAPADRPATIAFPPGRHILNHGLLINNRHSLTITIPANTQILLTDVNQNVLAITNSTNITIDGGLFQHLKPLPTYECHGAVLVIEKSSNILVRHATLNGSGAIGVSANNTQNLTLERCAITHNSFNAFYLDNCHKVRLWDNLIENNANTLQAYNLDDIQMSGNLIRANAGYWRTPAPHPGP